MKRRFISVLLALAMLFSVVMPTTVHALPEYEMENAVELVLDTSTPIYVNAGEDAYGKFTPEVTCKYSFVSSSDGDPLAHLYNSAGDVIAENDDIVTGSEPNFKVDCVLEGGQVYYLKVSFFNGTSSGDVPVTVSRIHEPVAASNNDGTHTFSCSACGDELDTESCEYIVAGSENGVTKFKCSVCGHSYYSTGSISGPLKTWDFEDGAEDWTFIDADGDGYNWSHYSGTTLKVYHGEGMIHSASYSGGALTPDNWAVSPAFSLTDVSGAVLSLWAVGQDPSYADEVFALYAGTSPEPDAMVMIGGDFTASGEYTNFTADLSGFDGEDTVYVAIRHYKVTDMFWLNVDYVEIMGLIESSVCAPGTHVMTEHPDTGEATCTECARCAYYQCDVCGRTFLDEEGLEPILFSETETSPALGHDWKTCVSNNDGTHTHYCSRCDATLPGDCVFETVYENGVAKHFCADCGYKFYSEISGKNKLIGWGFEEQPKDWSTYDTDGDGYGWYWFPINSDSSLQAYEGTHVIGSYSYYYSALDPDDWVVSPAFSLEGVKDAKLSLWASGTSANYSNETFALYASTSLDSIDDFVQISEDYTTEYGFVNYTADLSAFDGEPVVYIAIRHYDSYDMYCLYVDLVEIYFTAKNVCEEHDLTFVPAVAPTATEDGNLDYYYCEECGRYYLDEEATQPVFYEDVIIPALGISEPQFTSHRIVLTGEVGVQFKVMLPDDFDATGSSVSFVVSDGRKSTMNIADATPVEGENAYWFTCFINALELADTINATFNYGTDEAVVDAPYSAMDYITDIEETYDNLSQLFCIVRDLQNYGHYLQLSGWTDGKTHNDIPVLEGSEVSDDELDYTRNFLEIYGFEVEKNIEGTGVEDVKFALTLNSQSVINFFVKLEEGEEIVSFEGCTPKGTQTIGGDLYYKFNTEEINITEMFDDYTVKITTNTGTAEITANAMTYIYTVVQEGTTFPIEKQYAMTAYFLYIDTVNAILKNPSI